MSIFFRSVVFLLLLASSARAQPGFDLSGYAVNFPIYHRSNSILSGFLGTDRVQFVDVTRLRIRPSVGLWTDAFFMVEYEVGATYSCQSWIGARAATAAWAARCNTK